MIDDDSTNLAYWFHWEVLLCAIWILFSMLLGAVLILKYEIMHKGGECAEHEEGGADASLYADQCWMPCLKQIHPVTLLIFRILAFLLMSSVLTTNMMLRGPEIFYFYTQWTFTLLTIYFGLGSVLSIYGCYIGTLKPSNQNDDFLNDDTEGGTNVPLLNGETENVYVTNNKTGRWVRRRAGIWGHVFQVLFQMTVLFFLMKRLSLNTVFGVNIIVNRILFLLAVALCIVQSSNFFVETCGGAVVLTDCVYWFVIVPFLTGKYYSLTFLMVCLHSINVVLLAMDALLNCMRFPWHGIAYFILWTSMYVIFQWVLHACASLWWPYTFLDLSSPWAPLWYLFVGLLQIPCYATFALVIKMKHAVFTRCFPHSYYQC